LLLFLYFYHLETGVSAELYIPPTVMGLSLSYRAGGICYVGQHDVGDGSNGQSSGYHSSAEDGSTLQQQLSAVEIENQLLRNEVASLNQEMQSVIRRIQSSNEGVSINWLH